MSDELKHLNLTEKDFDLLVEGLEYLPEKGTTSELLGDLLTGMIAKNAAEQQRIVEERKKKASAAINSKKALKEDIKILQGKLLMLKRYLIAEGALKQAYEAINSKIKPEE